MTGQEIIDRYLTAEERRLFVINLGNSGWRVEYVLTNDYELHYVAIGSAFNWSDTPEGYDYWEMIKERIYRGDMPHTIQKMKIRHKFV